jgi:hypothetical protein
MEDGVVLGHAGLVNMSVAFVKHPFERPLCITWNHTICFSWRSQRAHTSRVMPTHAPADGSFPSLLGNKNH